jgi:hypothetical protein
VLAGYACALVGQRHAWPKRRGTLQMKSVDETSVRYEKTGRQIGEDIAGLGLIILFLAGFGGLIWGYCWLAYHTGIWNPFELLTVGIELAKAIIQVIFGALLEAGHVKGWW